MSARCVTTLIATVLACAGSMLAQPVPTTLDQARNGFHTKLLKQTHENQAPDIPPANLFQLVQYHAPVGKLAAYVTVAPKDGKKRPAIVWITGGFDAGIGSTSWDDAPASNDQSARAFREAGMVMMFPSLRGGNKNPGFKEVCYGEVDDVLAATDYLAKQPFVDPKRIYLGGHSTGGTLAVLVAERSERYRAVFAFGPVGSVGEYGTDVLPFDYTDNRELVLRAPVAFLRTTQSRLVMIEGAERSSNVDDLRKMAKVPHNDKVEFHEVPGFNHFSVLAPATKMIAEKLKADVDPAAKVEFTDADFTKLKGK